MHPETQLAVLAALTGFLLKTSLGFCISWFISKAVAHPRQKFLVWLGYLFLAACYWLWLLANLTPHKPLPAPVHVDAALPAVTPIGALQLQPFWISSLTFLLRGLGCLYLVVLAYFLLIRVKKHMHLRWILQFTYAAPEYAEGLFRPVAESLGAGNVQLLVLSGIYSPATFGWIKPIILLPPLCLEQDECELRDIFRHELQHVKRRDSILTAIASFCRSLLFFHPAAWYALRRLKLESELACDLAVVDDSPERRATYAECLVRFARLRLAQESSPWNLDFASPSVQLKVRVRSMLAGTRSIPGWMLGVRATLGLLLLAGFLLAAPSLFVVLSYEQPRPEPRADLSPPLSRPQSQTRIHRGVALKSVARGHSNPALAMPLANTPLSVPVETAGNAVPAGPEKFGGRDPTLRHRSDSTGTKPVTPAPGSTILLSSPASSASENSLARRASAVSAITAGARQALQVASHGHAKEGH